MRLPLSPLLLSVLALSACAGPNPPDPGLKGYARQWYVDNQSPCQDLCGSQQAPFPRIQDAISRMQAGDEVIIAGHDDAPYLEWLNLPKLDRSPNPTPASLIRAWKGMPKPIIRGSLPQKGWRSTRYPNTYVLVWDLVPADAPDAILEPQQVFRGSTSLQQVGGLVFGGYPKRKHPDLTHEEIWPSRLPEREVGQLQANQFMFDRQAKALYVKLDSPLKTDPTSGAIKETLDVSMRHYLAVNNVNHRVNNLTLQSLVFERSATSHYWRGGAVMLAGNNNVLDQVVVQDMDSFCVQLSGDNNTLQNSVIQRCGQGGLSASGRNLTVTGNQFLYNNTRRFNPYWEAGAMKFVSTPPISGAKITNNTVAYTVLGDGIWFDTFQDDNLIANNRVAFNDGIGIHIEVSNRAQIENNIIVGNTAQGIQLVDSNGSTVSGNIMVGNVQDGILIQEDSRAQQQPNYKAKNNRINKNTFAWNWELARDRNYRSIAMPDGNPLLGNYYCGTGVGNPPSVHFVVNNAVYNWASWLKAGHEKQATHQMASPPAELLRRLQDRDLSLVSDPGVLLAYIKQHCR